MTKQRGEDQRDYDTSYLSKNQHGKWLHRDYTAHFFRWCWVQRWVRMFNDHNSCRILEIGCGPERPLANILKKDRGVYPACYLGVDLGTGRDGGSSWEYHRDEFDFVQRWEEIKRGYKRFDLAVHLEVIEHMQPEHGDELLKGCHACLKKGGYMIMSTPVYNGHSQAANHIWEYEVDELREKIESVGFRVEGRYGTFANVPSLRKAIRQSGDQGLIDTWNAFNEYYDYDALSCFFAPLFPDHARNNLWICRRTGR